MRTFRGKALALGVAGVLGVMAFVPAHAYVIAESLINITNFRILGSNGVILNAGPGGDFAGLTFTGTADQSVSLTGFATLNNSASNPPTNPIDFAPICLGSGCNPLAPNNSFPKLFAPPAGNYSAADQYESGAPVANLAGFASPASVGNVSAAGLVTGTADASSNSNNNLNSSFVFTLNQSTGITFEFDLDAFLEAGMSADEVFPATATSSYQVDFTLAVQGGAPFFVFNVDAFGNGVKTISLNAPLFGGDAEVVFNTGGPVPFSATTGLLTAGVPYQLSARIQTNADVNRQQVPEPGILSLLGIALLGLGATAMRRRRT